MLVNQAKDFLKQNGYVVIKEKSYEDLRRRLDRARAGENTYEDMYNGLYRWLEREILPRERHLADRCTFLYGQARARGASVEELNGS